jgi:hypothetical protein
VALLVLAALPAIAGCSQSFWDRSPRAQGRVQGIYARGPLADVNPVDAWKSPVLTGDPDGVELRGDPDGAPSPALGIPMPSEHDLTCLAEVNRVRAQHGVPAVRYEAKLYAAAYLHSLEQMREGYLGHESRDAQRATLGQRMQQQGYVGRTYAEVVAKDFPDARSVVAAWMDSPRHREVLLDPDLVEAAFSRVDGPANRTNRWTGDFADPGRSYTPLPTPPAAASAPVSPAPQVPNPATRASVAPTPAPRSGVMPPARPEIPSAAAFPPASPSAPLPRAAVQAQPTPPLQPLMAAPTPQPATPRMTSPVAPPSATARGASTDGNLVPPPAGMRAAAPAAPYVVPSTPRVTNQAPGVAPRTVQPQPQPSAPYVATTPRSTYVPPAPTPPPTYRPSAPSRATRPYKKCGPGG